LNKCTRMEDAWKGANNDAVGYAATCDLGGSVRKGSNSNQAVASSRVTSIPFSPYCGRNPGPANCDRRRSPSSPGRRSSRGRSSASPAASTRAESLRVLLRRVRTGAQPFTLPRSSRGDLPLVDILMTCGKLRCVRTTVRLDDELLARAKELAARTGRSLTQVIADALRQSLAAAKQSRRSPARLPTFRGDGLQPGVNLDDTAALLSLMEEGR